MGERIRQEISLPEFVEQTDGILSVIAFNKALEESVPDMISGLGQVGEAMEEISGLDLKVREVLAGFVEGTHMRKQWGEDSFAGIRGDGEDWQRTSFVSSDDEAVPMDDSDQLIDSRQQVVGVGSHDRLVGEDDVIGTLVLITSPQNPAPITIFFGRSHPVLLIGHNRGS
ncbi:hypothetical protein ACLOJK_031632 [Asimina triloba]